MITIPPEIGELENLISLPEGDISGGFINGCNLQKSLEPINVEYNDLGDGGMDKVSGISCPTAQTWRA
jgi:hypothetical protein